MAVVEPRWINIQRKCFSRWCNMYLIERNCAVMQPEQDLASGILLCDLIEILTGKKLGGKIDRKPKSKHQEIGNLALAISAIQARGVKLVGIGPQDLNSGNTKLVLGLLWSLILRFQIELGDEAGVSTRQALLDWCNSVLNPQGITVKDFKGDWQDGRAFCGLCNAIEYGAIDLAGCAPSNALNNLNRAFDKAEASFGFPKVLDAPDVVDAPDELSIMCYVSFFRGYLKNSTAYGPNTYAEGPGLTSAVTLKPAGFTVHGVNEQGEKSTKGKAPVRAFLRDKSGADVCRVIIKDNHDGTYTGEYRSPISGVFDLIIQVAQLQIKGSAFHPSVQPGEPDPRKCVASGRGIALANAGEKAEFTIQTKDVGGNNIEEGGANIVSVLRDPTGDIPVLIVDNGNGTYSASYIPKTSGKTSLSVVVKTEAFGQGEIQDAPFAVSVAPSTLDGLQCVASGPGTVGGKSGEPAPVTIQAKDRFGNNLVAGGSRFAATLTHQPRPGEPASPPLTIDVTDMIDGTYTLSYTAQKIGKYVLNIKNVDGNIKNCPLTVTVTPGAVSALNCEWDGLEFDTKGRRVVVAGNADDFVLKTNDNFGNAVTSGGLAIAGKLEGPVLVLVSATDNQNGTYEVTYTPTKAGPYQLTITLNGQPIAGKAPNPFPLMVIPAAAAAEFSLASGDGITKAQVGHPNTFTIQARDRFENVITMGGAVVGGTVVRQGAPEDTVKVDVVDNNDGTYQCTYPTIKKAGVYQLTPTIGGAPIRGAPFTVNVIAGLAYEENSQMNLMPGSHYEETIGATLQLRDIETNLLQFGGAKVVARLQPQTTLTVPARANPEGKYEIEYPGSLRGHCQVSVIVNDQPVPSGPWKVLVKENPISPAIVAECQRLLPANFAVLLKALANATDAERTAIMNDLAALKARK